MKKLIALGLLIISTASSAQNISWRLHEVIDFRQDSRPVAGYIYQTEALGTLVGPKNEKFTSKLELICTSVGTSDPVIAVYWNKLIGSIPQMLEIKVDGRFIEKSQWAQEGPLLMKSLKNSAQLLQAMKTGRVINIDWTGSDGARRVTAFSLTGFNSDLAEFNKNCKL